MMRLVQQIRLALWPWRSRSPVLPQAETAYQQLREANSLLKAERASRASGNPIRDMVTGDYRPRQRSEADR